MNDYRPDSPIAKLAQALAAEFGEGWSVDAEGSYAHGVFIDGPDVRLYVRDREFRANDEAPTRLEISGAVPTSVPLSRRIAVGTGLDWGSIGVTATRPVDQIRAEIERRLLGTARTAWVGVIDKMNREAADRAARHAARDTLAPLIPSAVVRAEQDGENATRVESGAGARPMSDWALNFNGTHVDVSVTGVPMSVARQLAVLLYPTTK